MRATSGNGLAEIQTQLDSSQASKHWARSVRNTVATGLERRQTSGYIGRQVDPWLGPVDHNGVQPPDHRKPLVRYSAMDLRETRRCPSTANGCPAL
jgi:hypothetical protein